jgi:hypothetical protein
MSPFAGLGVSGLFTIEHVVQTEGRRHEEVSAQHACSQHHTTNCQNGSPHAVSLHIKMRHCRTPTFGSTYERQKGRRSAMQHGVILTELLVITAVLGLFVAVIANALGETSGQKAYSLSLAAITLQQAGN